MGRTQWEPESRKIENEKMGDEEFTPEKFSNMLYVCLLLFTLQRIGVQWTQVHTYIPITSRGGVQATHPGRGRGGGVLAVLSVVDLAEGNSTYLWLS